MRTRSAPQATGRPVKVAQKEPRSRKPNPEAVSEMKTKSLPERKSNPRGKRPSTSTVLTEADLINIIQNQSEDELQVEVEDITPSPSSKSKVASWLKGKTPAVKRGRGRPRKDSMSPKKVPEKVETEEEESDGSETDDDMEEKADDAPSSGWKYYDVNIELDSISDSSLDTNDWTPSECGSTKQRWLKKFKERGVQPSRVLPSRSGKKVKTTKKRKGRVYKF